MVQYDIGTHTLTHRCEINALYEDLYDENAEGRLDFYSDEYLQCRITRDINGSDENRTLGDIFYDKVDEILSRVENTGYAHNANNNFSLIPSVSEVKNESNNEYNIFLDCSGFVGYYYVC